MLLAIDTSTRTTGVALYNEAGLVDVLQWQSQNNQTRELAPAVLRLLDRQGMTAAGLTTVAVALGPGSFTGLRVGLSLAKGMCLGLGVPIIGISTLAAIAWDLRTEALPAVAALDAGRGHYWAAVFAPEHDYLTTPVLPEVEPLPELLKRVAGPAVYTGELSEEVCLLIASSRGAEARIVAPPRERVAALAALAWRRLAAGQSDDLATLQPQYLSRR